MGVIVLASDPVTTFCLDRGRKFVLSDESDFGFMGRDGCIGVEGFENVGVMLDCSICRSLASIMAILSFVLKKMQSIADPYARTTKILTPQSDFLNPSSAY